MLLYTKVGWSAVSEPLPGFDQGGHRQIMRCVQKRTMPGPAGQPVSGWGGWGARCEWLRAANPPAAKGGLMHGGYGYEMHVRAQ
jgi:hypothetical protein